jgi:hypothetical protein
LITVTSGEIRIPAIMTDASYGLLTFSGVAEKCLTTASMAVRS